jgi:Na+-translocating ferredoxin:NAD+ oxidoreductase RnfC subunit
VELLGLIAAAGVVGCGGAGFPTHVKLRGSFEYLIVNGAECEPLLRTDRYLMRCKAPEIIEAVCRIAEELAIPHAVIALKSHYAEEVAALRQAIAQAQAPVALHELESFYPAGDEQTIVYEVTGRVVPPAGLPGAVGAVVDNVATVYAIYEAMHGIPFTHKYLTVTGEVCRPTVLRVPVGTSLQRCIELAGGAKQPRPFVITGGPMMGRPVTEALDAAVVTKTTSGILVLPEEGGPHRNSGEELRRMLNRARSACIQCTACTMLCPRHLLGHPLEPHRIMRKMAVTVDVSTMLDDPDIRSAQLCCECGICEVCACPMGLQPRRINAALKRELAAAGRRYERREDSFSPSEERDMRKLPTEKVAVRAGVHAYYDYEIRELICAEPEEVAIPLKMHVGAAAKPVVNPGDTVQAGALIAKTEPGALGADIHASISGRVRTVTDRIVIAKE